MNGYENFSKFPPVNLQKGWYNKLDVVIILLVGIMVVTDMRFLKITLFCSLAWAVFSLCGCSTEHYKQDADREVYSIIDQKWDSEFGSRANYKIGDVPASPNDISAELPLPVSGRLSLKDAIALATLRNRSYQSQKEQVYLSALDLTLNRHRFNPNFFSALGGGYTFDNREEQVDIDGDLGFNLLLAEGAQISTNIAVDWMRYLTGDPQTSLGSVLTTTITQPLLRGRGRKIVQENLTQAERNTIYQIRSFNRFRKTFVVSIINDYYRLLQSLDAVDNARNNYENLKIYQDQAQMMAETGRLPYFELDQAKQRTLVAQDGYIKAREGYKQQLDQFKISMALPTDAQIELDPNELIALEKMGMSDQQFSVDDAVVAALECRLDLANTKDQVDDTERKVMVAADNLGAELNLIGSASADSQPHTRFANLQFHRGEYVLGLEADLPLDRKVERNAYREALIGLMRRQRDYEQKIDEVKLDVRQAYRDLQEAATRYRIQSQSLELANKRVESTSILLQEGRASTRDLLESRDSLLSAQDARTDALVKYTVARLNFFRDVGILQVRPDGLWETPKNIPSQQKIEHNENTVSLGN